MEEFVIALGWIGIYSPMALGAIGSALGCMIAGQASIGAMLETESGHGRYIGISAFPSTFVIYGIVVMFTLNREVTLSNAGGLFAIGLFAGLAFIYSGIAQGRACASSINASKEKPEIFGLSLAPAAIIEGFAVFAFVFALVISAGLPGVV
ncbi:MAG: ATP synthase subunit C [Pseudomonadota bacterium]